MVVVFATLGPVRAMVRAVTRFLSAAAVCASTSLGLPASKCAGWKPPCSSAGKNTAISALQPAEQGRVSRWLGLPWSRVWCGKW